MRAYLPKHNQLVRLILLTAICAAMIAYKYFQLSSSFLMFLGWNIFLAWIPLLALYLLTIRGKNGFRLLISILLWLVWVLFYPNAPYLITDIIHVPRNAIMVSYSALTVNVLAWYDIVLIMLSIWTGILLAFHALYPVHQAICNQVGVIVGHAFSLLICFLSSYGIYLGRFPRLNSWDVIKRPSILYTVIRNSFNLVTLKFVLLFGLLIYIVYNTLYSLERR